MREQQHQQQQPPSYGWNIPSDLNRPPLRTQQQQQNNLYPDLPSQSSTTPSENRRSSPSAPPLSDNNPPYPSSSGNWNAPYPRPEVEDHEMATGHSFNGTGEQSLDNVRSARLRRFESKS